MRIIVPAAIALLAAVPAAAAEENGEAKLAKVLAGRTAQAPVDCINLTPSNSSVTIPRTAIVYQQGSTYYVNRFDNGCPSLDEGTFIITRTPSTQLCRGDIADIRTTTPVLPRGSCVFGQFTPYQRPKK